MRSSTATWPVSTMNKGEFIVLIIALVVWVTSLTPVGLQLPLRTVYVAWLVAYGTV